MKSAIPVLTIAFCFLTISALAQTKLTEHVYRANSDGQPGKASIKDFTKMIGYWKGDGLGGVCEELWMPEAGGYLHGSFRMVSKEKLSFTEFMTLTIDSSGVAKLKVKHFNPDFTGWEEKNKSEEFLFLKKDENLIYFSGMTYAFESSDKVTIYVTFKARDGSYKEQKFSLVKKTL